MRGSLRYALSAALTLSLLEILLSSSAATSRVGGFFDGVSKATAYLFSPAYPLVPDRRGTATTSPAPSTPAPQDTPPIVPPPPVSATPPTSTGVISV